MNSFQKFLFSHLPCASLYVGSWNWAAHNSSKTETDMLPALAEPRVSSGHFIFQATQPRPGKRRWPTQCPEGHGRPRAGRRPPHSWARLLPGSLPAPSPCTSLTPIILVAHLTFCLALPPWRLVSERRCVRLFCSLIRPCARTSAHCIVNVQ